MIRKQTTSNKDVAIVIPLYNKHLKPDESISLRQLDKHLKKYPKYFLSPNNLRAKELDRPGYRTIRFDKSYFTGREPYNKLLLQKDFYLAFKKYKYILIYQLDALVFSDKLLYWCNKGYDYISSPWFASKIGFFTNKKNSPKSGGNGGFSLRSVPKSIKVLEKVQLLTKRKATNTIVRKLWFLSAVLTGKSHKIWLNALADNYPFNEDGFWSLEAPKYLPGFKVAPFKEALKFGFETHPAMSFKLNGGKLPFGCHAWARYDRKFWEKHLD